MIKMVFVKFPKQLPIIMKEDRRQQETEEALSDILWTLCAKRTRAQVEAVLALPQGPPPHNIGTPSWPQVLHMSSFTETWRKLKTNYHERPQISRDMAWVFYLMHSPPLAKLLMLMPLSTGASASTMFMNWCSYTNRIPCLAADKLGYTEDLLILRFYLTLYAGFATLYDKNDQVFDRTTNPTNRLWLDSGFDFHQIYEENYNVLKRMDRNHLRQGPFRAFKAYRSTPEAFRGYFSNIANNNVAVYNRRVQKRRKEMQAGHKMVRFATGRQYISPVEEKKVGTSSGRISRHPIRKIYRSATPGFRSNRSPRFPRDMESWE